MRGPVPSTTGGGARRQSDSRPAPVIFHLRSTDSGGQRHPFAATVAGDGSHDDDAADGTGDRRRLRDAHPSHAIASGVSSVLNRGAPWRLSRVEPPSSAVTKCAPPIRASRSQVASVGPLILADEVRIGILTPANAGIQ